VSEKRIADYLRYFNEERPVMDLTTERPMTYFSSEDRCPQVAGHLKECPVFYG